MGIMAGETGQSRIAFAPATAALQPISRESRIVHPAIWQLTDVPPRAVAGAAEIYSGAGIQVARIHDHSWVSASAGAGRRYVRSARPVATFAGNAWHGMGGIKVILHVRSRHVTTETSRSFLARNFATQSILQRTRNPGRVVRGYGNSKAAKKTDARFFEISIALEQKTLAAAAASKHPKYGSRKRLVVFSNRIGDRTVLFVQAVVERADVISCFSARQLSFGGRSRGVRHCVLLLARRQRSMALSAHFWANVIASGSLSLARPPARPGEVFLSGELFAYGRRHSCGDRR